MKTCVLCDEDFLEEDIVECELCHKRVCVDCIIILYNELDDYRYVCKECLNGEDI